MRESNPPTRICNPAQVIDSNACRGKHPSFVHGQISTGYAPSVNPSDPPGAKENPGALAGATGANSKAHESADESYARRASIARRKPLGNWNRQRWAWKRAVKRDARLSKTAKLVAITLCDDFAHHETARCNPFVATLGEATGDPERTVRRALAEIEAAGWIARHKGRGRGRPSEITFTADRTAGAIIPDNVEELAAYRPTDTENPHSERVPPVAGQDTRRRNSDRPDAARKPVTSGRSHIEPKRTKDAGAREAGPRRPVPWSRVVPFGSDGEREWQAWLVEKGLPPLAEIGRAMPEGWDMSRAWPPSAGDEAGTADALRFVSWLAAMRGRPLAAADALPMAAGWA